MDQPKPEPVPPGVERQPTHTQERLPPQPRQVASHLERHVHGTARRVVGSSHMPDERARAVRLAPRPRTLAAPPGGNSSDSCPGFRLPLTVYGLALIFRASSEYVF